MYTIIYIIIYNVYNIAYRLKCTYTIHNINIITVGIYLSTIYKIYM